MLVCDPAFAADDEVPERWRHTEELLAEVLGTPVVAEFKKEQADIEATTRRIRKLFGFFKLD